jgi:hypothetical protein
MLLRLLLATPNSMGARKMSLTMQSVDAIARMKPGKNFSMSSELSGGRTL